MTFNSSKSDIIRLTLAAGGWSASAQTLAHYSLRRKHLGPIMCYCIGSSSCLIGAGIATTCTEGDTKTARLMLGLWAATLPITHYLSKLPIYRRFTKLNQERTSFYALGSALHLGLLSVLLIRCGRGAVVPVLWGVWACTGAAVTTAYYIDTFENKDLDRNIEDAKNRLIRE